MSISYVESAEEEPDPSSKSSGFGTGQSAEWSHAWATRLEIRGVSRDTGNSTGGYIFKGFIVTPLEKHLVMEQRNTLSIWLN